MEGVYAIAKHPSADNAFQDSDSDEDELINIARSFNPVRRVLLSLPYSLLNRNDMY